jgi:hypothetical protein
MSIVSYLAVLHYLLTLIIVAQGQCGVCGFPNGHFIPGDKSVIFDRNGPKGAACFNFKCRKCGASCCTTTCALQTVSGQRARRVLSSFAQKANVYLPLRKPHERLDAYLGHGRSRAEMQAPGMGQYGRKRPGRSEGVFRSFNTKRTAVYWDYDSKINVLY